MKPTKAFRGVVSGSAYPQTFTPDDELSEEAVRIALSLGALSEEDATAIADFDDAVKADEAAAKAAEAEAEEAAAKAAEAAARKEAKAKPAAPENKSGGAAD